MLDTHGRKEETDISAHEITPDKLSDALGVVSRMPVEDQVYMFSIPEQIASPNDGLAYAVNHCSPEAICRVVKKYRSLYRKVNYKWLRIMADNMGIKHVYSMCKTYHIP